MSSSITTTTATASPLISVKGRREGVLDVARYPTKLICSFQVSLATKTQSEALHILYRLRVKESSILFSKTYGLLGCNAGGQPHPSTWDDILMYAQPAVMEMGKLSTIRVEYVALTAAEADTLVECGEVDKEYCRHFFSRRNPFHYEVRCSVHDVQQSADEATQSRRGCGGGLGTALHGRPISITTVVKVAMVVCIGAGIIAAKHSGISLGKSMRTLRCWGRR